MERGNKRKDKEAREKFRGLALSPRRARTSNFQSSNFFQSLSVDMYVVCNV